MRNILPPLVCLEQYKARLTPKGFISNIIFIFSTHIFLMPLKLHLSLSLDDDGCIQCSGLF